MSIHSTELSADTGRGTPPIIVKPADAMQMLSCSRTRLYELIGAREIESFCDGRSRKITTASISAYVKRKLAEAK